MPSKMSVLQEGTRDLRNIPGLARFVVEGIATGKQLGSGSYGSVEEVKFVCFFFQLASC